MRRGRSPAFPRDAGRGRVAKRPGEGLSSTRALPATPPHPDPLPASGARESAPNLVLLGEFGRAHGLRGEVRVKSYTAEPLAIGGYGPLTAEDGRHFTFTDLRQAAGDQPDLLVARVAGVATREAAERLNRVRLHVARERLHAATEEDEFLLADLVGLAAEDEAGTRLGVVVAVPNYGGGDLLEIALSTGRRTVLVPFTKGFVPHLDIAAGRLVVAAPDLLAEPEPGPSGPEV